jgi:hypothetical protein
MTSISHVKYAALDVIYNGNVTDSQWSFFPSRECELNAIGVFYFKKTKVWKHIYGANMKLHTAHDRSVVCKKVVQIF